MGWPLRWLQHAHIQARVVGGSMGAPPIAVELDDAPSWSMFSNEERLRLASSVRWVKKATIAADPRSQDEEPFEADHYARTRSFDAAFAASTEGTLFDVEAKQRPTAPALAQRIAMPTGQLFAQFAAQSMRPRTRVADERTVYVHGVFDLLSVGDLEFLRVARAMGDRLVVGVVPDDEACRIISNNSRALAGQRPFKPFLTAVPSDNHFPVHSLAERALSLMACKYVDDVVIGAPSEPDEAFLAANEVQCFAGDPRDHGDLFSFPVSSTAVPARLGILQVASGLESLTTTKDVLERVKSTQEAWLATC